MEPWNKFFAKKGNQGVIKQEDLVVLYWYLLHKPDYPTNIAIEIEKFKKNNEAVAIRNTIKYRTNIGTALTIMSEIGLAEMHKGIGREKCYEVKSAFLWLPYYDERAIEDPGFGESMDRYCVGDTDEPPADLEFTRAARKARVSQLEERAYLLASYGKDLLSPSGENVKWLTADSINEILTYIQKISKKPKEFLKPLAERKELNYISLWKLIEGMVYDLYFYIKPHAFESSYPPDPFFGTVPLKFYQTSEELEEKLEKFYKAFHSFYNRQRLIDKPLEKFKDIKSGTHIELSEKHTKEGIADTAVLDLKKIKNIPKEETPQELETRLVRLSSYLDFLIKTYENYGNETTSPPSCDFEDKMSSFEDMKKCLKEAENS